MLGKVVVGVAVRVVEFELASEVDGEVVLALVVLVCVFPSPAPTERTGMSALSTEELACLAAIDRRRQPAYRSRRPWPVPGAIPPKVGTFCIAALIPVDDSNELGCAADPLAKQAAVRRVGRRMHKTGRRNLRRLLCSCHILRNAECGVLDRSAEGEDASVIGGLDA